MLIFGQLTDSFINQAVSAEFVRNNTIAASCIGQIYNLSDTLENIERAASVNITTGGVNCDARFDFGTVSTSLEDLVPDCFGRGRRCIGNSRFTDGIATQCYIYVAIAVGVFLFSGLQSLLFQSVAERQIHLIRQKFYRAILRQDIGWFDANPSGELSSRLSE